MNEDELRSRLASSASHSPVSRDVLHRAQIEALNRRRRRDTSLAGVAGGAIAAIVACAVILPGVGGNDSPLPGDTDDRAEITLADTKVEAKTPAPANAVTESRPKLLVAASSAGRLVRIDPVSGKTTKVLTVQKDSAVPDRGALLGGVSISSDSRRVVFDQRTTGPCESMVRAVGVDGGQVIDIAAGNAPEFSPDSTAVAMGRSPGCTDATVVIRDLKSASERTISMPDLGSTITQVRSLSWSHDGSQLVVDLVTQDATKSSIVAFDVETGKVTFRLAPPSAAKSGTVWEWPQFLPDGNIFLSERCCQSPSTSTPDSSEMVVVDRNGKLQSIVAYGVASKGHTSTGSDQTGRHLFYLSGEDLMVSDDRGRPAPLAFGLLGASWR